MKSFDEATRLAMHSTINISIRDIKERMACFTKDSTFYKNDLKLLNELLKAKKVFDEYNNKIGYEEG